ncbi:MAG: 3-deoxy-manno-octulosonate cytidylyltransferase [Bacteroidota bacterium]
MKVLAIIPARYQSSRFLGKPLADIAGKSMIQRVYEQAQKASTVDQVIVATDDERIFSHVQQMNGAVMMTSPKHRSGTDRCAEVARQYLDYEYIVNIQGDEPFIQPTQIDTVVATLKDTDATISTLGKKIEDTPTLFNPNVVKVVRNTAAKALYFSRSPIPFLRGVAQADWVNQHEYLKHIGLYAFQRKTLLRITQLPMSQLETAESLEQLRWLEAGYEIAVTLTDQESFGIDTPEDLEALLKRMKA